MSGTGPVAEVALHIARGRTALAGLAADAAVLDDAERARAARFRFDADRETYRAAHVLLRRALSALAPPAPARWRFVAGSHGRPEIDTAACPAAAGLRFNLSHGRGLVCCAVTRAAPVGVDGECRRPLRDRAALAERFFAPSEAAAVHAAEGAGSDAAAERFYAFWTLKEAYVKALGLGLSMGLDRFAFSLGEGAPRPIGLAPEPDAPWPAGHWRCLLLRLDGGRCLVAAALPAPGGARFVMHLHGPAPLPPPEVAAATPGVELVPA
jgi:4'-phosphopantetheinyl transferase